MNTVAKTILIVVAMALPSVGAGQTVDIQSGVVSKQSTGKLSGPAPMRLKMPCRVVTKPRAAVSVVRVANPNTVVMPAGKRVTVHIAGMKRTVMLTKPIPAKGKQDLFFMGSNMRDARCVAVAL